MSSEEGHYLGCMTRPFVLSRYTSVVGERPVKDVPVLRQALTTLAARLDTGTPREQHFALCLDPDTQQALGLPKRCHGTYIDKEYVSKLLGPRNLATFTAACTATLLACEVATKTFAGALIGAAEAAALCGIPAATAHTLKGRVAEELERTGDLTLTTQASLISPLAAGTAAYALVHGLPTAQRAARYLLAYTQTPQTLATKARRLIILERWARKTVEDYWERYTSDAPLLQALEEPARLRLLANARPHDLAILKLAAQKAATDERLARKLKDLIMDYLVKGHRRTFYQKLLSEEAFRQALGLGKLEPEKIASLAKELEEARTLRGAQKALQDAGMPSEAAEALREAGKAAKAGGRLEKAKEALKGAACALPAYLAATAASWPTATLPLRQPPTLTLTLQDGTLTLTGETTTATVGG